MITRLGLLTAISIILFLGNVDRNDVFGIVSNLETPELASKAQQLGVSWVRSTAYWHEIEKSKGDFDWTKFDTIVERASESRLNLYITLEGVPSWANGNKGVNIPPLNKNDFEDFAHRIASRYSRFEHVKAYGLWNEPNLERFWKGSAEEYIEKIVRPGTKGIRQAVPDVIVAGPELSYHWMKDSKWKLDRFLNLSGADFDVITLHYYPEGRKPDGRRLLDFLDRNVRKRTGNRPVWITEISSYGCTDHPDTLQHQARFLAILVDLQKPRSQWFTKMFVYRLWDPQGKCDKESGYALTYGRELAEKPAFQVFRTKLQNR